MARGFGTSRGSANTDKVQSAYATTPTKRTIFVRVKRNGNSTSGTGYAAIAMKTSAVQWQEGIYYGDSQSVYTYSHHFASSTPQWTWTCPSTGIWHTVGLSYDNSSTSNDPVVYMDGSSVTVTEVVAPSGTPYIIGTSPWCFGNRYESGRVWNGDLQDGAIWTDILTADEHAALAAGVSPLLIRPDALVEYIDMGETLFSWVRSGMSSSGTVVQAGPVGVIPHSDDKYVVQSGAAGGTTKTVTITLVTSPTDGTVRASLSGLKWAFFDNTTPDSFTAPTDKGAVETTDGSGVLEISVPNSTKANGETGYLVVTDSDGTTSQSPAAKVFAGPVTVTVT